MKGEVKAKMKMEREMDGLEGEMEGIGDWLKGSRLT